MSFDTSRSTSFCTSLYTLIQTCQTSYQTSIGNSNYQSALDAWKYMVFVHVLKKIISKITSPFFRNSYLLRVGSALPMFLKYGVFSSLPPTLDDCNETCSAIIVKNSSQVWNAPWNGYWWLRP